MLIQNVNSAVQAPQPVRLPSDGGPRVADASGSSQVDAQQPSAQQLKGAVDSINLAMRQANKSLELSIDSSTKRPVVRMMDSDTGELIRQYPSKEVLAIAQGIDQFLSQQGMLLNKKA
jgi:flagellar protein FlaG